MDGRAREAARQPPRRARGRDRPRGGGLEIHRRDGEEPRRRVLLGGGGSRHPRLQRGRRPPRQAKRDRRPCRPGRARRERDREDPVGAAEGAGRRQGAGCGSVGAPSPPPPLVDFSGFPGATGFSAFSGFAVAGVGCGRAFSAIGFAGAVLAGRVVRRRPGAAELLPRAGLAARGTCATLSFGVATGLCEVGGITFTSFAAPLLCPGAAALRPLLAPFACGRSTRVIFAFATGRTGFAAAASGATRTAAGRLTGVASAGAAVAAAGAGSR